MSKINHRRTINKPRKDSERYSYSPMGSQSRTSVLADIKIGAGWGGDNSNGHRGHAQAKAGAKKFINSRIRFHENRVTKQISKLDIV